MMRPMNRFKQFDIVTVPFPYTDKNKAKKRPAIILSQYDEFDKKIGHSICAMITSEKNKPWPHDVSIKNLKRTGLPAPSVIRMKFFTLDHQIIIEKIGTLSAKDLGNFKKSFKAVFLNL